MKALSVATFGFPWGANPLAQVEILRIYVRVLT
jgi:hypothetical protein